MWVICYKFAQLLLLSRLIANAEQQISCFKHKYQKYLVELKFLSPLSLIDLDTFVRLKIPSSGFTILNSPCMIVQRIISTIRNKITRSFVSHKNRKTKDGKMYFINILVPSLRTCGIWKWICSQKRDRNINNTNFYIFCFCFPFKMLLVLLLWFYHIIVTKLLT